MLSGLECLSHIKAKIIYNDSIMETLKGEGMSNGESTIIGAGKIGRCFFANLFAKAGYNLLFVNGSPKTVNTPNAALRI